MISNGFPGSIALLYVTHITVRGYNEATLSEYLNVYDCSKNASLARLAGDYLQLYHLDMAFEMTGSQRGGSKSRCCE